MRGVGRGFLRRDDDDRFAPRGVESMLRGVFNMALFNEILGNLIREGDGKGHGDGRREEVEVATCSSGARFFYLSFRWTGMSYFGR